MANPRRRQVHGRESRARCLIGRRGFVAAALLANVLLPKALRRLLVCLAVFAPGLGGRRLQ